ncbi:MAG: hypothetical protein O3A06_04320 [Proteobacteria bacterium]|nr:hypothetical protein [Pseudomonadota bacterium]
MIRPARFGVALPILAALLFAAPAARAQTIWRTDTIEEPVWER